MRAVTDEDGVVDQGSGRYFEENLTKTDKKLLSGREIDDLEAMEGLVPSKVLDEFLNLWNGGEYRDASDRLVELGGKTYKIVFAGDMSWGDEPEGGAYEAIKHAYFFGFPYALGCK